MQNAQRPQKDSVYPRFNSITNFQIQTQKIYNKFPNQLSKKKKNQSLANQDSSKCKTKKHRNIVKSSLMQYLPFVCSALIQSSINDRRQACVNPDLKGCLSCLCHPSAICVCVCVCVTMSERVRERKSESFWLLVCSGR